MSLVARILGLSPYLEVTTRRIYWSSPWLVALATRRRTGAAAARAPAAPAAPQAWERIEEFLRGRGVAAGSLLIVHSSASALKPTGLAPARIIDRLLAMVGPAGTLAMPAFPRYDAEPQGIERMRADVAALELDYDVQKSVPWTGVLPLQLMRRAQALRSRHPLNSMVALGPLAAPMMEKNLEGERPLPCGPGSSWRFCADRGAIIVALGVDMAHSLTMIHVAEDCHEQQWPIRDWYRERRFRVLDHGSTTAVVVRERHPWWAAHYGERTLSRDLKRARLLASVVIDGILVECIAAAELLKFLARGRARAYPYFMIPRRKWKST